MKKWKRLGMLGEIFKKLIRSEFLFSVNLFMGKIYFWFLSKFIDIGVMVFDGNGFEGW